MSEAPDRKKRGFWGPRRWHRYLGAVFALPLLWLCVTGLLLQHQEALGLTRAKVRSGWLLGRYGQMPEGIPRQAKAGRFTVNEWGGVLFIDGKMLEESGVLVGALAKPAELVVATENELFVYDAQGAYRDRLREESLPGIPLERLGWAEGEGLLVEVGGKAYALDESFLEYAQVSPEAGQKASWSVVEDGSDSTPALRKALTESAGFTWARVVTDLHSGSLLGKFGRFLVDLTGIAVVVATLLGLRLLFKRS